MNHADDGPAGSGPTTGRVPSEGHDAARASTPGRGLPVDGSAVARTPQPARDPRGRLPTHLEAASALIVLDAGGVVLACSPEAGELLGRSVTETVDRPVDELFEEAETGVQQWLAEATKHSDPLPRDLVVRPRPRPRTRAGQDVWPVDDPADVREGAPAELHCWVTPLDGSGGAGLPAERSRPPQPAPHLGHGAHPGYVLHFFPVDAAQRWLEDDAVVRELFAQNRFGLTVHDSQLRVTRSNLTQSFDFLGSSLTWDPPQPLSAFLLAEDAAAIEADVRHTMEHGIPQVDVRHRARNRKMPDTEWIVSLTALPLRNVDQQRGVLCVYTDVTEHEHYGEQLATINAAAKRIGTSLDVRQCAEELAEVLVPDFADLVAVDLTERVRTGEEPAQVLPGTPLTRVAVATGGGGWPSELYGVGETVRIRTLESDYLQNFSAVVPDWERMTTTIAEDEQRTRLFLPPGGSSYMIAPLHARGLVLGAVSLWRTGNRTPFDQRSTETADEVVSRAALAVDNARRYTQERRTAEALRRSLTPPETVKVHAAEAAGVYVPAASPSGGGDSWFDVIRLSSARVAFVVGDTVGHGLEATAATGRLRTAVQTLSDLDLPPEDLLAHLDDLVLRLAAADPSGTAAQVEGASCLYAVYDPASDSCQFASAGHPPPVVVNPDGSVRQVGCVPGSPLGEGSMPFEPVRLDLPPGSLLALYSGNLATGRATKTDSRTDAGTTGADAGTHAPTGADCEAGCADGVGDSGFDTSRFCRELRTAARERGTPAEIGHATLAALTGDRANTDTVLLVTRQRGLPPSDTNSWEFAATPSVVSEARDRVLRQLTEWGLDELTFSTELIVSELLANSIRYATGPIGLRLIKDDTSLYCEVSDTTQAQPHLRRARLTDEGGRGLYLIHQLTHRWGSRYTYDGKTIWTQQLLLARDEEAEGDDPSDARPSAAAGAETAP